MSMFSSWFLRQTYVSPFFSRAGFTMSDRQMSILPTNIEAQLDFNVNASF